MRVSRRRLKDALNGEIDTACYWRSVSRAEAARVLRFLLLLRLLTLCFIVWHAEMQISQDFISNLQDDMAT